MMIAKAHMRGLWEAGGRCCFLVFTLCVSVSFHGRFTLIFSHARHIDAIDVHWCSSCLHGLALRSPGSWLGGSRVSALRFFCLAPFGSSCDFDGFVLLLLHWMTCSGRGTQAAWSLCFKSRFGCFHSTAWMWCFFGFCVVWFVCVWVLLLLLGVFGLVFACLAVEWHHTAGHHEYMKPATVSASLAVISTASKYLHNDLARAIKALEQKKLNHCIEYCPFLAPLAPLDSYRSFQPRIIMFSVNPVIN